MCGFSNLPFLKVQKNKTKINTEVSLSQAVVVWNLPEAVMSPYQDPDQLARERKRQEENLKENFDVRERTGPVPDFDPIRSCAFWRGKTVTCQLSHAFSQTRGYVHVALRSSIALICRRKTELDKETVYR